MSKIVRIIEIRDAETFGTSLIDIIPQEELRNLSMKQTHETATPDGKIYIKSFIDDKYFYKKWTNKINRELEGKDSVECVKRIYDKFGDQLDNETKKNFEEYLKNPKLGE